MKTATRFLILLVLLGLIAIGQRVDAIDITVTGSWPVAIDASDLQSGAGSDLNPTYLSATDQIRIRISNTNTNWRVRVRISPYNPDYQFRIRRTTDGGGPGTISGGTSWMQVTDSWQLFFTGSRPRRNIRVQVALTGISVQIPPGTYAITVEYRVVEP